MKIKVEFELTPEEFRESLGLPNISALQDEALSLLKARLTDDLEDMDLGTVVQSWFTQGIAASRKVQEILASAAAGILDPDAGEGKKVTRKKTKTRRSS